jgi:uncharacterized membrane protein SpoIIM required for sporulation
MNEINEKNVDYFHVLSSNLLLVFKNFGFGLITISIYSLFSLINNVISLGIISNALLVNNHTGLFYKMIPHGILEIFGIVLSLTAVLYCLYKLLQAVPKIIKRKESIENVTLEIGKFIIAYTILEIIIFSIAAVIEILVSLIKIM